MVVHETIPDYQSLDYPVVWRVPRLWPDATVVCIGSGPSLTAEDVDYCRGRAKVIAINNAYQLAPWSDVLYACDGAWWDWHQGAPDFGGIKVSSTKNAMRWPGILLLELGDSRGLSDDPTMLCHGSNSGYQAVNLAYLLGASRIVLLGYDFQLGPHGEHHWHGAHPNNVTPPVGMFLDKFPSIVEPLRERGIDLVNCSAETALTCVPRRPLREVLP